MPRILFKVAAVTALGVAVIATPAGAADSGFTLSATELRERPFLDAPSLARLPGKTTVEILERQGGWMRVRAETREGWVRLLAVRLGTVPSEQASGGWLGRFGFGAARGRAGSPASATVTTGIRGLSPVELEQARPDAAQVQRLRSLMATPEQAKLHADAAGLTEYRVPAFDEDGRPTEVKP